VYVFLKTATVSISATAQSTVRKPKKPQNWKPERALLGKEISV